MEHKYKKEHVFQILKYICPRKVYRNLPLKQIKEKFDETMNHRDVEVLSKSCYHYLRDSMIECVVHPAVLALSIVHFYHGAENDNVIALNLSSTVFRIIDDLGERYMFADDFDDKIRIVGSKGQMPRHDSTPGFHRMISQDAYGEYIAFNVTLKFQKLRYDDSGSPFPVKSPKSTWCIPAWYAIQKLIDFLKVDMKLLPTLCQPCNVEFVVSAIRIMEDWFPHENAAMLFVDYEKLETMCDELETRILSVAKYLTPPENSLSCHEDTFKYFLKKELGGVRPSEKFFHDDWKTIFIDFCAFRVVVELPNLRKYIIKTGIWEKLFGNRWFFDPNEATPALPTMPYSGEKVIVSPVSLPTVDKIDNNNNEVVTMKHNLVVNTKNRKESGQTNECSDCDTMRRKMENYKKSAIDQDKAIEKMKKIQETTRDEVEKLMKTVDEKSKTIDELETKNANLLETMKAEREEFLKKTEHRETSLKKSLEEANCRIADILKENDDLKLESTKSKKGRNVAEPHSELKKTLEEAGKANSKLEKKVEKMTKTINENRKMVEKYHALEKNIQKITESKKTLSSQLSTSLEEYKTSNILLENRVEDFRKKLIEKCGIIDEKNKENHHLRDSNQMLVASLEDYGVKVRELEEKNVELSMSIPMNSKSAKQKLEEMKEALNDPDVSEMKKKMRESYDQFLKSYPGLDEAERATQELSDYEKNLALYEYVLKSNIHKIETCHFIVPRDLLPLRQVPELIDFTRFSELSNLEKAA